MALIALAGVSRIRYPKSTAPQVYFSKLREFHPNQKSEIDKREASRKKSEFKDNEAFECMVLDLIEDIIMPNRGPGRVAPKTNIRIPFGPTRQETNIEKIFYQALRCVLVHEGQLTPEVFFTPRTSQGDELRLTHPTGIPEQWIPHLIGALEKTPEIIVVMKKSRRTHKS